MTITPEAEAAAYIPRFLTYDPQEVLELRLDGLDYEVRSLINLARRLRKSDVQHLTPAQVSEVKALRRRVIATRFTEAFNRHHHSPVRTI